MSDTLDASAVTEEGRSPAPAAVVVLAAGAGTRMRSATPKVLHRLGGRSMLGHALAAAEELEPEQVAVVVRHERELVAAHVVEALPSALLVDQDDVPGTGRAVQCALDALDAKAFARAAADGVPDGQEGTWSGQGVSGAIVVVAGDVPLLDGATLAELVATHHADGNAVTVLTSVVADPVGYGRVVREDATGDVLRIVEHKDASAAEREITEINTSIYVFDAAALRDGLGKVGRDNAQGEVYLPDVLALARDAGGAVRAVIADDAMTVEGVNDRAQLAVLGAEMNRRVLARWMADGVTVVDPATTWVDVDVELAEDVTLLPGTQLHGTTTIARGAVVGPDSTLTDMEIGEGATVTRTHASLSVIGAGATVGPFAYLRPGTRLGARGKIGTFVETKNAEIGDGSKVPHLSYIGDATIGEETNVGAASVTVNYDGVNKHRTVIGSYARTGADNMFVAPVRVGDGVYTGAGSVIRRDVPSGALAVSAGSQRNLEGWTERRRPGTPAAQAAAAAREGDGADRSAALGRQARVEEAGRSAAADAERPSATPPPPSPGTPTLDGHRALTEGPNA
ncbi:bifunctional UDP-N-acetylglucosamine diphosphorylase/glucosamine-1-phosphate N-acetyltransferase GlmU [Cellulomonas sp. PhB143]|uniref:bifunctional UDP-N-acetylglucosamine diphosphorylase/glucosamine-1-phosphate N-acetyltransferase GlmU n=1 Tax=Cellulomonas sp. PhB143 TaxID=2485186 RepID=UPI000F4AC8B7|nr:bifunctional UDP-N-acetylglucosamine diphosphorylase/glucosamine-1-phosphate N-acetyltransferase GlmU [Cellulomonas sp. PhB143]ROS78690.1 bifunctional UDP-N-acetylglucosamine pyrophosphorylase/glucosamine-1-phosphate N-acetyltransferase [Cellulomonas sp. PhB143]